MNRSFFEVVNEAILYLNQVRKEDGSSPLSVARVDTPQDYKKWVWNAPKDEVLEVARVATDLLLTDNVTEATEVSNN